MSITTAAIEVLVAKGLSAQDILDVARALDVKSDPTAAERKRRQRQRESEEREEMSHRDVTRDTLSLPPNENNSNPPTHTRDNIPARVKGAGKSQPPAKPDDVAEQTWRDFLTHRRAKSAPVTETVIAGIRREAAKAGWAMDAALAEVVTRGWQSFKAEWAISPPQTGGPAPGSFLASLGSSP